MARQGSVGQGEVRNMNRIVKQFLWGFVVSLVGGTALYILRIFGVNDIICLIIIGGIILVAVIKYPPVESDLVWKNISPQTAKRT